MPVKIPLNIVIDSNIFRQDLNFKKPDFKLISELARLKLIRVHIPWFVYKECTSHLRVLLEAELDKAVSSLSGLERKGLHSIETRMANKLISEIDNLKAQIDVSVERLWNDFITETFSKLYPFEPTDSITVFDDYFIGRPPFSTIKSRKDIPDAFIYQTLLKISKSATIHLISDDDNLRSSSEKAGNIITHKNFEKFFSSPAFNFVRKKYDGIKKFERIQISLIERIPEIKFEIENHFLNDIEQIDFEDRYLPSDNNDGTIVGITEINSIEIFQDEIKFIDDKFYLPTKISADCIVNYTIFKADYYIIGDGRKIHVDDLNDHFYDAEETLPIVFNFSFVIPKSDVEADVDIQFKMNDFESIEIGEVETNEIYYLDHKKLTLKANEEVKVNLARAVDISHKKIKVEYVPFNSGKKHFLSISFFSSNETKQVQKVRLNPSGETEFKPDFISFLEEDYNITQIAVGANIDLEIQLSIYKNEINQTNY